MKLGPHPYVAANKPNLQTQLHLALRIGFNIDSMGSQFIHSLVILLSDEVLTVPLQWSSKTSIPPFVLLTSDM
jgi:hypothetical protein